MAAAAPVCFRSTHLGTQGVLVTVTAPFRRVCEPCRERKEMPSATDPYPTASHPKRSRILSMAWSAAQRAMPFLVPRRRASSVSPSGSRTYLLSIVIASGGSNPIERAGPHSRGQKVSLTDVAGMPLDTRYRQLRFGAAALAATRERKSLAACNSLAAIHSSG
jgi:hypothetical protein